MTNLNFEETILKDIEKNEGKLYILFLLNSLNQQPILGKTKLMKELFFISNNVPSLEKLYSFEADNYGPSSDAVARFLDDLTLFEVISLENKSKSSSSDYFEYSLTDFGKKILESIKNKPKDTELIEDMKILFDGLTTDESLALTYFSFPETTVESLVKGKIEKNRVNLALNLYKKNKVSLTKASYIAGIPIDSFLELLRKNNILVELSL